MSNELNYYGTLSETGLTVIARVYDSAGAQVGSDVSILEGEIIGTIEDIITISN